jgi:hypothetical protein
MKRTRTKTTTTGLLVAIILLLSAALFIQAGGYTSSENFSRPAQPARWENPAPADYPEPTTNDRIAGYGAPMPAVEMTSESTASSESEAAVPAERVQPAVDDLRNANSLVGELRRIVRAGQKMDVLRSTGNNALSRRCVDGMKKLQADLVEIRKRRRNVAVSGSAGSLNSVFLNMMKCVSCNGDAMNYCVQAEQELNEIDRSLSIN